MFRWFLSLLMYFVQGITNNNRSDDTIRKVLVLSLDTPLIIVYCFKIWIIWKLLHISLISFILRQVVSSQNKALEQVYVNLHVIICPCSFQHKLIKLFWIQIALNKPSGLQVLPGGLFQQRTVLKQLQWRASKQSSSLSSQASHPVPVHRLGRGTSGQPRSGTICLFHFHFHCSFMKHPVMGTNVID